MPLVFHNSSKSYALEGRGAYVDEIGEPEMNRNEQQAPTNILKTYVTPSFNIHVGNGQLQKTASIATFKTDNGNQTTAENFFLIN